MIYREDRKPMPVGRIIMHSEDTREKHPAFHLGNEAAKREPYPGETISDGVHEYLVLDDPRLCSSIHASWLIFKVPPVGLFKLTGTYKTIDSKAYSQKEEMKERVLRALPKILEELDLGVDVSRRQLQNHLKRIMSI